MMRRVTKAYVIKLEQKCRSLQERLENAKSDDKRHSEEARQARELNDLMSKRCDQLEQQRSDFQSTIARLERERDEYFKEAAGLQKERNELLEKFKEMAETLDFALTVGSLGKIKVGGRTSTDVRDLEHYVRATANRIRNDADEINRLQGLLNGTAIAVGILGQKLSRG